MTRIPANLPARIDEAAESLAAGWPLPYAWMDDRVYFHFEVDAIFGRRDPESGGHPHRLYRGALIEVLDS